MNTNNTIVRYFYKVTNKTLGDIGIVMSRCNSEKDITPTYNECVVKGIQSFYNYLIDEYDHDYNNDDYEIELMKIYEFTINNNKWNNNDIHNHIDYTYELKNRIIDPDCKFTRNKEIANDIDIKYYIDNLYRIRKNLIHKIKEEDNNKQEYEYYELFFKGQIHCELCSSTYNKYSDKAHKESKKHRSRENKYNTYKNIDRRYNNIQEEYEEYMNVDHNY